jgi:hypothetical protein
MAQQLQKTGMDVKATTAAADPGVTAPALSPDTMSVGSDAADTVQQIAADSQRRMIAETSATTQPLGPLPLATKVEFPDREAIANWLEWINPTERRNAVAVTLAARAGLRVLPLIVSSLGHPRRNRGEATGLVLQVFRALALSWFAARYSIKGESFRRAANSATGLLANNKDIVNETDQGTLNTFTLNTTPLGGGFPANSTVDIVGRLTAFAAVEAVKTASANAVTFPREFAVQFAVNAVYNSIAAAATAAARDAMGSAAGAVGVDDDANAIDARVSQAQLVGSPLWLQGRPNSTEQAWQRLKAALLSANEGWEVWTDWYEARLAGDAGEPPNEALEIARATIPDEIWR